MTIIRTDDQVVLAEKSNQVWQLFIGFASHPQPVLPEEFLRVIESPVACVPTRCSSRAESPLAEVIKSGQHQLDEYHLTRNAGVRLYWPTAWCGSGQRHQMDAAWWSLKEFGFEGIVAKRKDSCYQTASAVGSSTRLTRRRHS